MPAAKASGAPRKALRGSLAPDGAVLKQAGTQRRSHTGPARVFDDEQSALAAIMALSARARRNTENLNLWDVAGGLVITGCAASVMGEPEQVAQLFEHLFERRHQDQ